MTAPSKQLDQFVVRLPDGMRDQIKASAQKNNRSMNAEIVHAIGFYFAFDDLDPSRNKALEQQLDAKVEIPEDQRSELIKSALADLERQLMAALDMPPSDD